MLKHRVEHVKLDSGLEGLIIDTPKTGVVVAEFSFRAGEFLLPDEKWETAHLMEHVLLGANKYYDKARDFQVAIEQNGAMSNASTSVYDITYEIEAADFEWKRVLGLLCDAISTPAFLQEEFDSEHSNVREELMLRSNNHFRHLNLGLRQQMGLRAFTDDERLELMANVTSQDLVDHYKKTHTLPNCRFIIAGNFDRDYSEVLELLQGRLKLPKRGSRVSLPDEIPKSIDDPYVVRKPSVPNIYFYFDMYADRVYEQIEKDAMYLLSIVLTQTMYSRIFGTARERGLVYDMSSGMAEIGGKTGWWLGAQVSKSNSEALLRVVRDELKRLREGVLDEEDFERARKNLLGKTMRSGQTASGLVNSYGSYYNYGEVLDLNKWTAQINKLTAKRCLEVFNDMAGNDCWGIGTLGSTSLVPARKLDNYIKEVFEKTDN